MTSTASLKSLSLTAFRGASTELRLEFEKGKKLTLIYGENGTGKTTICDAFEFLAIEKLGSLEDRGMGKGLEKFWPTAGKASKELVVQLETSSSICSGRIIDKKVNVTPSSAKPRIELLRRQQVLRLIEARPADLYNEIKRFIDIAEFEKSEEALRQLAKSISADKEQVQRAELENLGTLQGFFDAAGKPADANPVVWAKNKLIGPTTNRDDDIATIGKLRTKFSTIESIADRLVASSEAITAAKKGEDAAEVALASAVALSSAGAEDLLKVLEAGQDFLHAHPNPTECPLCSSAEKASGLAETIKARLDHLRELKDAHTERLKQRALLGNAQAAHLQFVANYAAARVDFLEALSGHTWRAEVVLPSGPPPIDVGELIVWLAASASCADSWPALEATWRDERRFVAALKSAVEQYDSNLAARMELEALVPKTEKALQICVAERQAFTDGILKEIAQEVGRLYEIVHPGEGLDKIAMPLDPDRRASLELRASFSDLDAPPQAYFSQSHLDTLGLCVFQALALRDRVEDTILILDDVLGSVDEPHVDRVIQMIYGVSSKFRHTIVTTHYRPWREKYRWGWLKSDQACQFIELTGWDIEDGIRIIGSLPEIDRLKFLLAASPIDPQAICSKAGVILEAALDYLTQKYECSVPRRLGAAYTLGDLLPSVGGKLRETLTVEIRESDISGVLSTKTVPLKPILDILQRIAQTRNAFGAHFKAISFELLDTDAIGFAKQVVALMDAMTHPDHGWPSNDKSGSYWRNSGDTRRLHPLKKPG